MVFPNYCNTSYLPLDSDQAVTFYKNENLLFSPPPAAAVASPSALVCRRNTAAAAAMLTASTGSSPFGSQPLHHGAQHGNVCDDFQPVAHLSSNGYYGYVPANSMPKVMSTEGTPPAAAAVNGSGSGGVLLESHHPAAAAAASGGASFPPMMMDCGGGGLGEVENYHHLQQQQQQQLHLRKRKEFSEEVEGNCKRRKTWLEEQPHAAGFTQTTSWHQPPVQQMECHDQPMDTYSAHQFNGSPVSMNAATTTNGFNGFHHQPLMTSPPMPAAPQPPTVLQPKNRLFGACSPSPMPQPPLLLGSDPLAEKHIHHRQIHPNRFGDNCQELEDLFISLHGSGFYLSC